MSIYDLITRLMYIPKTEDGMPRYTTVRVWLKFRTAIDRSWQCPIAFILFVGKKNSSQKSTSIHKTKQSSGHSKESFRLFLYFILFIYSVSFGFYHWFTRTHTTANKRGLIGGTAPAGLLACALFFFPPSSLCEQATFLFCFATSYVSQVSSAP